MADHGADRFTAYVRRVTAHLRHLPPEQRAIIEAEMRSHLADAAAERGLPEHDDMVQRATIARLGPAWRLGRAFAAAYRPTGTGKAMRLDWVFVVWWVSANTAGWMLAALGSGAGFSWRLALVYALPTALSGLLLWRSGAAGDWVGRWLLAGLAPWAICAGYLASQPWGAYSEAQSEQALLSGWAGAALLLGAAQWLAMRRHVPFAFLWMPVPLLGLVIGLVSMMAAGVLLVSTLYGLVTGVALVALLRRVASVDRARAV